MPCLPACSPATPGQWHPTDGTPGGPWPRWSVGHGKAGGVLQPACPTVQLHCWEGMGSLSTSTCPLRFAVTVSTRRMPLLHASTWGFRCPRLPSLGLTAQACLGRGAGQFGWTTWPARARRQSWSSAHLLAGACRTATICGTWAWRVAQQVRCTWCLTACSRAACSVLCVCVGAWLTTPHETLKPAPCPSCTAVKFRLLNGTLENSGRLEVAVDGIWGKVMQAFVRSFETGFAGG